MSGTEMFLLAYIVGGLMTAAFVYPYASGDMGKEVFGANPIVDRFGMDAVLVIVMVMVFLGWWLVVGIFVIGRIR